jgi:hypothetical protein
MTVIRNLSRTHAQLSSHPKWKICIRRRRYRRGSEGSTPSNQIESAYHRIVSKLHSKFAFTQHGVEAETAFSSTKQGFDQRGYKNHSGRVTELQNGEKTWWPLVKMRTQQSIFSGITSRGSKIFFKRRLHGIRE